MFALQAPQEVITAVRKPAVAAESADRIIGEHLALWDVTSGPEASAEQG